MDMTALLNLIHQFLPPNLVPKALEAVGALTVLTQIVPRLLAWGVPAATRAADTVAQAILASPLRPLILWKAPQLVAFLDAFTAALEQIADTFKNRLEADIKAAADAPAAPPPAGAPPA